MNPSVFFAIFLKNLIELLIICCICGILEKEYCKRDKNMVIETRDRPMLTTDEQIEHLKLKGVKFDLMPIAEARAYLEKNNNYFKLRAYRKNFQKHPGGTKADTYVNLDFEMLKDLSIIDMKLRYVLIHMALDIEHFAKVKLLKAIQDSNEDGYEIVVDYQKELENNDRLNGQHRAEILKKELARNTKSPYCGALISKYYGRYPIWVFVEVISLGSLTRFYKFCADRLNNKEMRNDFYLLSSIRELRNACAHNNCILNDLSADDNNAIPNYDLLRALGFVSKATRDNKLKNMRIYQITATLYTHDRLVQSKGIKEHTKEKLNDLINRMYRNIGYYSENDCIVTNFDFLRKCVDNFFP